MKGTIAGLTLAALIASGALAQTSRPPADALAVRPISSEAQTGDADVIRTKIEQAGYVDVTGLSRDTTGIWRARAKKGNQAFNLIVDKGGRIKPDPR